MPGNKDFSFFYLTSAPVCLVVLRIFVKNMKKINTKIVSCASVFIAGLCGSARAEEIYPDHAILWHRLVDGCDLGELGKGVKRSCPIPGAYKELLKIWNEEAGPDGMLPKKSRKEKGFEPFWINKKCEIYNGSVRFDIYAYAPQYGGPTRLTYPVHGEIDESFERGYYKELPVDEGVKKAIRRCTHIVSSEAFLTKVLGDDYVRAFISECSKECSRLGSAPAFEFKYILYPIAYHRCFSLYLDKKCRRFGKLYFPELDRFKPLSKGLWSQCMDQIVVDMEIYQTHQMMEKDGEFVRVSGYAGAADTKIDFQLCLRLIFNTKKEEIEAVAMYDIYAVNRPINVVKNGFRVIFGDPDKYFRGLYR